MKLAGKITNLCNAFGRFDERELINAMREHLFINNDAEDLLGKTIWDALAEYEYTINDAVEFLARYIAKDFDFSGPFSVPCDVFEEFMALRMVRTPLTCSCGWGELEYIHVTNEPEVGVYGFDGWMCECGEYIKGDFKAEAEVARSEYNHENY